MDCRRSLVLGLAVALGCGGCIGSQTQTRPQAFIQPDNPQPHQIQRASDGPKRTPKIETLLAAAQVEESQAFEKNLPPTKQREFRDRARVAYQQALSVDSSNLQAYLGLARVYRELGENDRALETYQKAAQKHPREVAVWVDMGKLLARKKDFDGAIQCLQKALQFEPESREAKKTLGLCLISIGRIDDGIVWLTRSVGPAVAHHYAAGAALYLGEKGAMTVQAARELCRQHLQMALQADPNFFAAREMLSQLEAGPAPAATVPPIGGN